MKRIVWVVVISTILLSGCSTNGEENTSKKSVSKETSEIDKKMAEFSDYKAKLNYETSEVVLPLDEIIPQKNMNFTRLLKQVENKKMAECYLSSTGKTLTLSESALEHESNSQDRMFGVWSVSYVSKYGYEFAGGHSEGESTDIKQGVKDADYEKCYTQFRDEHEEMLNYSQGEDDISVISFEASTLTINNASYKKYSDKVVACYKEAGYEAEISEGMVYPVYDYGTADKETKIKAAVTEAKCNVDTGFIENAYNLYARYQLALMDGKEALVAENKTKINEYIKQLEAEL